MVENQVFEQTSVTIKHADHVGINVIMVLHCKQRMDTFKQLDEVNTMRAEYDIETANNVKKSLAYYLNLKYKLNIIPNIEDGGYVAEYPELPGCITCAETIEEVKLLAEEAKRSWLIVALYNGDVIPKPSLETEGTQNDPA